MLSANEFPILPWGCTPGDRKSLESISECGFNLAGFVKPQALDAVAEAGLKAFVIDETTHVSDEAANFNPQQIEKLVKALVARTKGHKAVFGYYLRDEPGASAFAGLGRWAKAFRKAHAGSLPYINLFPNYASPEQLKAKTYAEYLERFVKQARPDFISYDHYALMNDGSLRDGYFQNLEAVRKAARRHDLPFWNIVLGNSHFDHAEPSQGGLNFQLFTTLAYGGRGISYFTYFTPTIGNYRLAAIDQFGNKTPTWNLLRYVNLQLHKLGPVYLTLKNVNVFHHPNVPRGCSGMKSSKLGMDVSGDDLLVGEFKNPQGKPFAMVVNKSLHKSTVYQVKFRGAGRIMRVNSFTGNVGPWLGEDCWLAPGQGALLCLE